MEKDSQQKTQEVCYYGKKTYRFSPLIARRKAVDKKIPNYQYEDIDEKRPA